VSNLLIVDDEEKIRVLIKKYADFEGHTADEAGNGLDAVRLCRINNYDLIIMDIMMPELDGFSALREIRKFSDVPVLFLSARGEEYDKINGFESGADDYVVKPFSPKELMLRVKAIIARKSSDGNEKKKEENFAHEIYEKEGLLIDFTARAVFVDGVARDLTPKEYDLLFYLVKNRGIALSREKLISAVWGYDFFGGDRTLDTHIKLLRKSLCDYGRQIVTLRGVGYRFDN
jgi:DNA-binding response OmpR family regulator